MSWKLESFVWLLSPENPLLFTLLLVSLMSCRYCHAFHWSSWRRILFSPPSYWREKPILEGKKPWNWLSTFFIYQGLELIQNILVGLIIKDYFFNMILFFIHDLPISVIFRVWFLFESDYWLVSYLLNINHFFALFGYVPSEPYFFHKMID